MVEVFGPLNRVRHQWKDELVTSRWKRAGRVVCVKCYTPIQAGASTDPQAIERHSDRPIAILQLNYHHKPARHRIQPQCCSNTIFIKTFLFKIWQGEKFWLENNCWHLFLGYGLPSQLHFPTMNIHKSEKHLTTKHPTNKYCKYSVQKRSTFFSKLSSRKTSDIIIYTDVCTSPASRNLPNNYENNLQINAEPCKEEIGPIIVRVLTEAVIVHTLSGSHYLWHGFCCSSRFWKPKIHKNIYTSINILQL